MGKSMMQWQCTNSKRHMKSRDSRLKNQEELEHQGFKQKTREAPARNWCFKARHVEIWIGTRMSACFSNGSLVAVPYLEIRDEQAVGG